MTFQLVDGHGTCTAAIHRYVAPDGDDAWQGTLPAPNAARNEGPFATMTRARDAIRALKQSGRLGAPVTITVLHGRYHFAEPLILGPHDSGTADTPITYKAYPGHTPVLSGGRSITRWRPYKGKILQAPVPEVAGGRWKFRQLFFNGERQVRARWPRLDPNDALYGGWAFVSETLPGDASRPETFRYEGAPPPRAWRKPHLAEINIFPWFCWLNDILPLKGIDTASRRITCGGSLLMEDLMKPLPGNRFIVENVLEELDGPGQWCLDSDSGTVYFWPPRELREVDEVTAPCTYDLIVLKGSAGTPVRWITINGFTMTQTLSPFPEWAHPNFHSPTRRGAAIRLEHAEDCRVVGNDLRALGGDGIRLQEATADNCIVENEIGDVGASGISIAGDGPGNPHLWTDQKALQTIARACPASVRNVISHNHIHHCGTIKKTCGAIHVYGVKSLDCRISHNLIHDTSDKGISLQDGFGRFFIEYNDLRDIAREIGDTGGIVTNRWYVLEGDDAFGHGTVIRYNRICNVIGCCAYEGEAPGKAGPGNRAEGRIWTPYMTWGIYFDNSPMHFTVYGNIVVGTVLGGICMPVHDPKENVIENNIFIDGKLRQVDLMSGRDVGHGNRFVRNIVYGRDPDAALLAIGPTTKDIYRECDSNLYFNEGGGSSGSEMIIQNYGHEKEEAPLTFRAWQAMGFDAHSLCADPLFVDARAGDFRLRPESPVFSLGFKPIDFERIGRSRS